MSRYSHVWDLSPKHLVIAFAKSGVDTYLITACSSMYAKDAYFSSGYRMQEYQESLQQHGSVVGSVSSDRLAEDHGVGASELLRRCSRALHV